MRQFVGYEKELEVVRVAVLPARMLARKVLLVGLALMQVRKMTVTVR